MELNKSFDLLIKASETKQDNETTGYLLNDRLYCNYMDNAAWKAFIYEMQTDYPSAFRAYGKGAGNELGIKKIGKTPPKMASYGSSSRMIYLLSRDISNFIFEEKLPTTVGGTAHMDGYLYRGNTAIYIEAKCREPYSTNYYVIDRKYETLYRHINDDPDVNITCEISVVNENKMKVMFVANGLEITRFDIKQMISHLLGIATRHLKTQSTDKIQFLYLLYNPKYLEIADENVRQKIFEIYDTEIKECESIPFKALFKVILEYLHTGIESGLDIVKCVNDFSFGHCDHKDYLNEISNI